MRPMEGLLTAPFSGGMAVLDPNRDRVHVLGSVEGWLASLPGPVPIMELVEDLAVMAACSAEDAKDRIHEALATLRRLELVDVSGEPPATGPSVPPEPPATESSVTTEASSAASPDGLVGPGAGAMRGRVHSLMGARIAFRSVASDLLDAVDDHLDGGAEHSDHHADRDAAVDRIIDLEQGDAEDVVLRADDEWHFPSLEGLLAQVDQIIDDFASRTEPLAILSGHLVVLDDGSQVLVTGPPASNRSAVVGALIARGGSYAGRSLIGLSATGPRIRVVGRRFRLEDRIWELLESTAVSTEPVCFDGPIDQAVVERDEIDEVWFVAHDPNQFAGRMTGLGPIDALERLLSVTVNRQRLGSDEFELLCKLAERATVTAAVFDDPWALAEQIAAGGEGRPVVGATVRSFPSLERWRPRLRDGVSVVPFGADGHRVAFATVGGPARFAVVEGSVRLLDPLSTAVLAGVDGAMTVDELSDRLDVWVVGAGDRWTLTSMVLLELAKHGLIEPMPSGDALPDPVDHLVWPDGPWTESSMWFVNELSMQEPTPVDAAESLAAGGVRFRVRGAELLDRLRPFGEFGSTSAEESEQQSGVVEIVQLPGGFERGVRFRVSGLAERWVSGLDAVAWVASLMVASQAEAAVAALPPVAMAESVDGVTLFLEPWGKEARGVGDESVERVAGALLTADGDVLVPRVDEFRSWLDAGGRRPDLDRLYQRQALQAVAVPVETTELGRWTRTFEQLHGHHGAGLSTFATAMRERLSPAPTKGETRHESEESPHSSAASGSSDPDQVDSDLFDWIRSIGSVAHWDESVKIDTAKITPVRPLYRVDLERFGLDHGSHQEQVEMLTERFETLGLPATEAGEAAAVAVRVGEFHLGEERTPQGEWRRKLYVWTVSTDVRPMLSDAWADLAPAGGVAPSWVAWKFASAAPEVVVRSVDLPYLDEAETVADAVEPTLALLPPAWRSALAHLFTIAGVDVSRSPVRDDAVTVEDAGRYTTDISVRGSIDDREGWRFEAAVRWLAAVAGHGDRDIETLVWWVRTRRMSNLIFGIDGAGEPFLNLYMGVDRDPGGLGWSKPVDRFGSSDDTSRLG